MRTPPWIEPALYALLFVIGIGLRVGAYSERVDQATFTGLGDAGYYLEQADAIRRVGPVPDAALFMSPYYPYLLATLAGGSGTSFLGVVMLQTVLGICGVAAMAWLARRHAGAVAGVSTAALGCLAAPLVLYDGSLLADGPAAALLAVALAPLAALGSRLGGEFDRRALTSAFVAGCLAGVAAGLRPNLLLIGALLVVWMLWILRRDLRRGAMLVAAFAIPLACLLVPVSAINFLAEGLMAPTSYNAGLNLYLGHNPTAGGTYSYVEGVSIEDPRGRAFVESTLGRRVSSDESDRFWRDRALAHIAAHPWRTVRLTLRKATWFWLPFEIPQTENLDLERERSLALRVTPVGFGLVLPLAVAGWWGLGGRSRRAVVPLMAVVAATWITCAVFFVNGRFRLPIWYPAVLLAGCGVAHLMALIRQRSGRVWLVGAGMALVVVAQWSIDFPRRWYRASLAATYAMTEALEGNLPLAHGWLDVERRASAGLAADPMLQLERGKALYALGDYRASFDELQRAARALPHHLPAQVGVIEAGRRLVERGAAGQQVQRAIEEAQQRIRQRRF